MEGDLALKVEGTRLVRNGKHAVLAVLASVLLASCATSSDGEFFGYSVPPSSGITTQSSDFAQRTVNSAAGAEAAAPQFVMDENDPTLPEDVASAPDQRPVSAEEAAAMEQALAAAEQPVATDAAPSPEASPVQEVAASVEPASQVQEAVVAAAEPKKRGFLAAFFGNNAQAAPAQQPVKPLIQTERAAPVQTAAAQPIVELASTQPQQAARPLVQQRAPQEGGNALPGVRADSLFEITRRSGLDDDSDIDLFEGEETYQIASAAGLARLAPNGLTKQTDHVDVACLKPSLVRVLKTVERHFGKPVIVTSGYRGVERNRRARGARNSLHMYCAAADIQVEGVGKAHLANFMRSMPGRGGVGTYCHTQSVHVDVGPERDWNWRCRRRK